MHACFCSYVGLAENASFFDGLDGYRHTASACWALNNPLMLAPRRSGSTFEAPNVQNLPRETCKCPIKDLWSDTGHARNCPERKVTK